MKITNHPQAEDISLLVNRIWGHSIPSAPPSQPSAHSMSLQLRTDPSVCLCVCGKGIKGNPHSYTNYTTETDGAAGGKGNNTLAKNNNDQME